MRRYANEFTFLLSDGHVKQDTIDSMASLSWALHGKWQRYQALFA